MMKAQAQTKTCLHCTNLGLGPQPIARFSKNAAREDGLQDQCRKAAAELYQKRTYGKKRIRKNTPLLTRGCRIKYPGNMDKEMWECFEIVVRKHMAEHCFRCKKT